MENLNFQWLNFDSGRGAADLTIYRGGNNATIRFSDSFLVKYGPQHPISLISVGSDSDYLYLTFNPKNPELCGTLFNCSDGHNFYSKKLCRFISLKYNLIKTVCKFHLVLAPPVDGELCWRLVKITE
jgi:hypothetical protein